MLVQCCRTKQDSLKVGSFLVEKILELRFQDLRVFLPILGGYEYMVAWQGFYVQCPSSFHIWRHEWRTRKRLWDLMYLIVGMQITGWVQMEPPLGSYASHLSDLNA